MRLVTRPHIATGALGAALLFAGLGAATAHAADDFPISLDPVSLTAWLKANTDLAADQVAIAGPVHVVAVTRGKAEAGIQKAVVRGEVVDRDWAAEHRFVSWSTDIEVDCKADRVKSPSGKSYVQRKRRGSANNVFASADWTTPEPADPIYSVVRALCGANYAWPLRGGTKLAAAPPPPPVAAPPPRPQPAPDAPMDTSARQATPPPPPAPAPTLQPPPPRTAAAPPPPTARPYAAPPAPPKPASAPERGGAFAVQVLASSTESKARAELASLARMFTSETRGLTQRVVPTQVNGKTYYRAMFAGLAGQGQAQTLCKTVGRLGYECIVRKL